MSRSTSDGKAWFTIFVSSRWFLFLTCFLLLLTPANAFDCMHRRNLYPLPTVIGRSIYVFFYVWTIYRVATGNFRFAIPIFILQGLNLIIVAVLHESMPDLALFGLAFLALQTTLLIVTLRVYRKRTETEIADVFS